MILLAFCIINPESRQCALAEVPFLRLDLPQHFHYTILGGGYYG